MSARLARLLVLPGAIALAVGTPAAALADPPQDPPGNNGTIKVQPYGGVPGHGSSPHPGCDFRLQLFGFDADQTGTVTFVGQAPTEDAVTKQPLAGSQLLSDDAARGGQDADAHFDVRGADLGLTGTPARQGFHVKVLVDADDAPGGAKSKVLWLDCPAPAAAPATGGTAEGTTAAPATTTTSTQATSTTVQGTTSGAATAGAATAAVTTATTAVQDTELLATTRGSALRAATLAAAGEAAPGSAAVDARSSGRSGVPSALAFTGLPAAALAGLGLLVLALGVLAVVAGRRRTT